MSKKRYDTLSKVALIIMADLSMLQRTGPNIHMAETADGVALPQPLDLQAIDQAMRGGNDGKNTTKTGDSSMIHTAGKNHVVSDRKFGTFWNWRTQGLLLSNLYNVQPTVSTSPIQGQEKDVVHRKAELHPAGPGIRFLRMMPGAKLQDRFVKDGQTKLNAHYQECLNQAESKKAFIKRQIKRAGYLNPPIHICNSDDVLLFRVTNTQNEPDDSALIRKIVEFHQFVIEADAEALSRRIEKGSVLGVETCRRYPETAAHIHMPPMVQDDGQVYSLEEFTANMTDSDGDPYDEYVPEIAQDKMQQYVVYAQLPTPTLLNCVDDRKYLREHNSKSPLGKNEYDEGVVVKPMRVFNTIYQATEFKDNFAKHAMPEAEFYIVRMDVRVPILDVYTEWAQKVVPQTFHKQVSQAAMVDMPEAAAMRREIANLNGIDMVHLGPEQTKEEAEAEMDKLRRVQRANARIAKTQAMMAKLQRMRERKENGLSPISESDTNDDETRGGGASKDDPF